MRPQPSPYQAPHYSARAPRAAIAAADFSALRLPFASLLLVVSLGLSLAIILPR